MTAETYVNQIVKKIKCSRKKRAEIRRQLLSDVSMAVEQGTPFEKVMLQMGEPIAIAEEFNENLPAAERKKYKSGIAAKIAAGAAAVIAVLVLAGAWFLPRGAKMGSSGIYNAAEVEEQVKAVIRLLDAEDYDALLECSDAKMESILTKEIIDEAKEQVGADWGGFKEFGKCYMQELKQRGRTFAFTQINVAYENTGVTYTLLFDEDKKLSGLYIK